MVALIGERLRGLPHCKMWGYELHGMVPSSVLLDRLFFGLQTPFPAPLEFLQECLLALELLLYVRFLPLLLSLRVANSPNQ